MDPITMAMIGSTVLDIGGGIMGGNKAKKAAKQRAAMIQAFLDESVKNYGQRDQDLTQAYGGYTGAGDQANELLSMLMNGDMSGFFASPDYEFRKREGINAVENSASARGLSGGNVLRGIEEYGSDLASQEFGDFWNRLVGQQGVGLSATGSEQTGLQNNLDTLTNLKGQVLGANLNLNKEKNQINQNMISGITGSLSGFMGNGGLSGMFDGGGGGASPWGTQLSNTGNSLGYALPF